MTSSFYRGGSGPLETHTDYAVGFELIISALAFTLTCIKYVRLKKPADNSDLDINEEQ